MVEAARSKSEFVLISQFESSQPSEIIFVLPTRCRLKELIPVPLVNTTEVITVSTTRGAVGTVSNVGTGKEANRILATDLASYDPDNNLIEAGEYCRFSLSTVTARWTIEAVFERA